MLCDTPIGIRSAVFDVNRGFLLNGEHVKLNGVCVHQDAGCVGSAVPERMWERRLELLREMGCNAIRTSHNPYAAEFLDLCDRMGFLVMNEAFDEWRVPKGQIKNGYHLYFDEWHERDLKNFIHRDRNHPSVVLWSAGNEVPDQSAPDGAETLRGLLAIFHAEDPTRPVTVACDQIASEPLANRVRPEFLAQLDIVGYNYVDRWRNRADLYYSIDREAFPQRRFIGTESVGVGGIRGEYRDLAPQKGDADAPWFSHPSNLRIDAEQLWQFVDVHDYVSGDFMWTGIDYLGESRWPMKSASSGVMDTCGFRKDGFYFYQSQWTAKPMLHLFPHWNWQGSEGAIDSGDLLHELRHGGAVSERKIAGREGLRVSAPWHGGPLRQFSGACARGAHHRRSASLLGRALRAGNAARRRHEGRQGRDYGRSCRRPAKHSPSASAPIARASQPIAAMLRTSPLRFRTRRGALFRARTTTSVFRLRARDA